MSSQSNNGQFFDKRNDQLLDEKRAAAYIGLTNHCTMAVWRSTKRYNIPFVRIGRSIRYRKSDLDKFLEDRLVT